MTNNQIRNIVVPRIFEKVGLEVVNKRNLLGSNFNLKKNQPDSVLAIEALTEEFNKLSKNEKFKTEQYITSLSTNSIFRQLKQLIEQSFETGCKEKIAESMNYIGNQIIKNFKNL